MGRYTKDQRIFIVKQYFKNNEGLSATVRNFRAKYDQHSDLKPSTVKRIIEKFKDTGSVSDLRHSGRPVTSRSTENIAAVRESIAYSSGTSIRHRSQELGIPRSTLQRILTKDLQLHAHKVQLTQELKSTDNTQEIPLNQQLLEIQQDKCETVKENVKKKMRAC